MRLIHRRHQSRGSLAMIAASDCFLGKQNGDETDQTIRELAKRAGLPFGLVGKAMVVCRHANGKVEQVITGDDCGVALIIQ
jgi:hypothetical protein